MAGTQVSEATTSTVAAGRLRVVFLFRVEEAAESGFLAAYERIRDQVAAVDGHLVDQVCQSLDDPRQWMITSEWGSPEHFLAWEASADHRELVGPLAAHTTARQSLRFVVRRQTG